MDRWIALGDFIADGSRREQTFALTRPAWVKFMKIRFITHHGSEFFCPVSLVRVHGFTYLQEFKEGTFLPSEFVVAVGCCVCCCSSCCCLS